MKDNFSKQLKWFRNDHHGEEFDSRNPKRIRKSLKLEKNNNNAQIIMTSEAADKLEEFSERIKIMQ